MSVDSPTTLDPGAGTQIRKHVLLVDDHDELRRVIKDRLVASGFQVMECATGEQGLAMLDRGGIDAVVLDVHLPGVDGFAVLRAIRQTSHIPVLLLTAAGDETDRVLGLEIGADDYMVKPFSSRELVARLRAVLRRAAPVTASEPLVFGNLVIDLAARVVTLKGQGVTLTPRSFDLLAFLAGRPGQTFSRDQLLQRVWQSAPEWQNGSTVTEHVHRLRRQIEDNPDSPVHLITVRAKGYRFDP